MNKIDKYKVTVISPDFLIAKGFSKEYYQKDFEVYNDNNEYIIYLNICWITLFKN